MEGYINYKMSSSKNTKLKFLLIGLVALGTARQDLIQTKNPPIILPDIKHSDKVFESKNYHPQIKAEFRGKNFQSQNNRPEFIPLPHHIIEKQKSLPIQVYQKQKFQYQQPQHYQKQVEKKYFYPQPKHYQESVHQESVHYQSVHPEPIYQRPVYHEKEYQRPVYQQPGYQRPVYQQHEYQRPIYQQPIIHRPVYQQQVYQRPVYQQPEHQRPVYKVLPPPTFIEYPYYGKGKYYEGHEEKQRGKSFIHQVKKAQRQFDPKNILKKEQRQKEQKQEEQKENQQRNWDEEKKKYYLEHYYKLHQYDNYQDRPQFWKGFDDDFYAYKRGVHKQQTNWHQYEQENHDHDHDYKNDQKQYHKRRQPYQHQEQYGKNQHYEHHLHEDHDSTKGVHPNPLLPQPYPEVQCKSKNCQKSHNIREGY